MLADEVVAAARACDGVLRTVLDDNWDVPAGELEWSCRETGMHIAAAQLLYAAHLSTRATQRRSAVFTFEEAATPSELLAEIEAAAAILADVVRAAPDGTRAFHPAGMADPSGFAAMGCDEILVHTWDIARGLRIGFEPPGDLAAELRDRLFPWAPTDCDPWDSVLWANGRIALPHRPKLDENWYWQCAPLSEWDGTINGPTTPPRWR